MSVKLKKAYKRVKDFRRRMVEWEKYHLGVLGKDVKEVNWKPIVKSAIVLGSVVMGTYIAQNEGPITIRVVRTGYHDPYFHYPGASEHPVGYDRMRYFSIDGKVVNNKTIDMFDNEDFKRMETHIEEVMSTQRLFVDPVRSDYVVPYLNMFLTNHYKIEYQVSVVFKDKEKSYERFLLRLATDKDLREWLGRFYEYCDEIGKRKYVSLVPVGDGLINRKVHLLDELSGTSYAEVVHKMNLSVLNDGNIKMYEMVYGPYADKMTEFMKYHNKPEVRDSIADSFIGIVKHIADSMGVDLSELESINLRMESTLSGRNLISEYLIFIGTIGLILEAIILTGIYSWRYKKSKGRKRED